MKTPRSVVESTSPQNFQTDSRRGGRSSIRSTGDKFCAFAESFIAEEHALIDDLSAFADSFIAEEQIVIDDPCSLSPRKTAASVFIVEESPYAKRDIQLSGRPLSYHSDVGQTCWDVEDFITHPEVSDMFLAKGSPEHHF